MAAFRIGMVARLLQLGGCMRLGRRRGERREGVGKARLPQVLQPFDTLVSGMDDPPPPLCPGAARLVVQLRRPSSSYSCCSGNWHPYPPTSYLLNHPLPANGSRFSKLAVHLPHTLMFSLQQRQAHLTLHLRIDAR